MIIKAALRSLDPDTPAAELREAAADIDEQVGRLNRIVNDVLDFARPLRFDLAPADVAAVCREAAAAVAAGDTAGPAITVQAEPVRIVTDAERLRSALVNVLANAVEAVRAAKSAPSPPAGSGADVVMTAEATAQGGARIVVRDRGVGIDGADAAQIFEPVLHDPARRNRPRPAHHAQHHRGPRRHHHRSPREPGDQGGDGVARSPAPAPERTGLGPARLTVRLKADTTCRTRSPRPLDNPG